jgi:hypothetical protein
MWVTAQVDAGGMPSSHSSLCMGITTAVAVQQGLSSALFPVCLGFSLIVMYDAAGVRRHAGKQAEVRAPDPPLSLASHLHALRHIMPCERTPDSSDFMSQCCQGFDTAAPLDARRVGLAAVV